MNQRRMVPRVIRIKGAPTSLAAFDFVPDAFRAGVVEAFAGAVTAERLTSVVRV
jgi:hypothetical protein